MDAMHLFGTSDCWPAMQAGAVIMSSDCRSAAAPKARAEALSLVFPSCDTCWQLTRTSRPRHLRDIFAHRARYSVRLLASSRFELAKGGGDLGWSAPRTVGVGQAGGCTGQAAGCYY